MEGADGEGRGGKGWRQRRADLDFDGEHEVVEGSVKELAQLLLFEARDERRGVEQPRDPERLGSPAPHVSPGIP
eukprot:2738723-Rhodomonas_salina.1